MQKGKSPDELNSVAYLQQDTADVFGDYLQDIFERNPDGEGDKDFED